MHITETETLNKPNASKPINKKTDNTSHTEVFQELHNAVFAALETYSNVHRGSGYNSIATTFLFDKAREIVSKYLQADSKNM
ncbi:MAG: hypothetical protein IPO21_17165 [Bacteroidales bacterium]|nr:hypothetical protein [Bacteroidales bacterium]